MEQDRVALQYKFFVWNNYSITLILSPILPGGVLLASRSMPGASQIEDSSAIQGLNINFNVLMPVERNKINNRNLENVFYSYWDWLVMLRVRNLTGSNITCTNFIHTTGM